MKTRRIVLSGFVLLFFATNDVSARIKLVALPDRANTIIRLDNPSATLVEEERILTLKKGSNQVDFSWNGVYIDPDSIRIRMIFYPDNVRLISLSYPPSENALVWDIYSDSDVMETVRISYLLKYIDRLITYEGKTNKDETLMEIKMFMVIRNFSGEDFLKADIHSGYTDAYNNSIQHEETKKLLMLTRRDVPIKKIMTFDANEMPWEPEKQDQTVGIPVTYKISNDKKSGLGEFLLPLGKFRVYQDDGHKTSIFLGEDSADLTPIGKEIEISIGKSRDLKVTQRLAKQNKINLRKNSDNRIILYDTDEVMEVIIENFKDKDQSINIIEHIPGHWDMEKTSHPYEKEEAEKIKFDLLIPAQGKTTLSYHYHRRNLQ